MTPGAIAFYSSDFLYILYTPFHGTRLMMEGTGGILLAAGAKSSLKEALCLLNSISEGFPHLF